MCVNFEGGEAYLEAEGLLHRHQVGELIGCPVLSGDSTIPTSVRLLQRETC